MSQKVRRVLQEVAWLNKGLNNGLRPFARNRHFAIYHDESCRLLYVQRSSRTFESSGDLVSSFSEVGEMLEAIDRKETLFLGDTRGGPSRNDPRYEEDMTRVRSKLLSGYKKSVTLTATVAGQLQIRRYAQCDRRVMLVTSEVGEAFQYLALPRHLLPPLVENETAFWRQDAAHTLSTGRRRCHPVSEEQRPVLWGDSLFPD